MVSKSLALLLLVSCLTVCHSADTNAQQNEGAPVRVIFRGDDMGISHSSNTAIIRAYKQGVQNTTEVIVPGPWFPEAVRLLGENPGLDVGVHLALTSEWEHLKWRPITHSPSLTDSLGYFQPFIWPHEKYGETRALLGQDWKLEEIEQELRDQIEMAKASIENVTHLTAHMGMSHMAPEVSELVQKLADEYKLNINPDEHDFQSIGFEQRLTDGDEKADRFIEILKELEPGNYIFVTHPDLDVPSTRALFHKGYEDVAEERQSDTDLLTNLRVQEVIEELDIEVISYSDILDLPH